MNKTKHDITMLMLIGIPVACLTGIVLTSFVSWKAGTARINDQLKERYSKEALVTQSPHLDRRFDNVWTTPVSIQVVDYDAIVGELVGKYRDLIQIIDDRQWWLNEEDEPLFDEMLQSFSKESAPYTGELHERLDPDHESFGQWESYVLSTFTEVDQLLRLEYEAAVRSKDTDRATKALNSYRQLFQIRTKRYMDSNALLNGMRFLRQVSDSIGRGDWDEDTIEIVQNSMRPMLDVGFAWNDQVEKKPLTQARWLQTGTFDNDASRRELGFMCSAPSARERWIWKIDQMGSVNTGNLMKIRRGIDQVLDKQPRQSSKIDTLIQYPFADQTAALLNQRSISGFDRYADYVAAFENERRHARTLAAMVRYKSEFGEYPDQVRKLQKIGYPSQESEDYEGRPFLIESNGQGKFLVNLGSKDDVRYHARYWILSNTSFEIRYVPLP